MENVNYYIEEVKEKKNRNVKKEWKNKWKYLKEKVEEVEDLNGLRNGLDEAFRGWGCKFLLLARRVSD